VKEKLKSRNKRQRWKYLLFSFLFLTAVFHYQIEDLLLEKYGICKLAIISDEVKRVRYHKGTFYYKFWVKDEKYMGDTYIESDSSKVIGQKICIVYLRAFPNINRSREAYFKSGFEGCNCK